MIQQKSNVSYNRAGFTLIELVMVIVVIGILSAVAMINNPFNSIKLNRSVTKVIADIRYVQKLAISNQTRAGITFNTNGYTVYSTFNPPTPPTPAMSPGDTCSSDASNNFVVDFIQPRCSNYSGITLAPDPTTIAFNSLGKPVTSGGGYLGTQIITVSLSGTGSQDIHIEEGTGRVY